MPGKERKITEIPTITEETDLDGISLENLEAWRDTLMDFRNGTVRQDHLWQSVGAKIREIQIRLSRSNKP